MKEVEALSEQRLQEIRERAEKATKGPWWLFDKNGVVEVQDDKGKAVIHWTGFDASVFRPKSSANAEFIAHARTDIPDLLAELTRSRAALLEMENRVKKLELFPAQFIVSGGAVVRAEDFAVVKARAEKAEAALLEVERQREELVKAWRDRDVQRIEEIAGLKLKLEAAEQKLAEQRWIPVSEKLPDANGDEVLVQANGFIFLAMRLREPDEWELSCGGEREPITKFSHWRELPAAPLVEREG